MKGFNDNLIIQRNRIYKNNYNDDYVLADIGNPNKETTITKKDKTNSQRKTNEDKLKETSSMQNIKDLSNYLKRGTSVELLQHLQSTNTNALHCSETTSKIKPSTEKRKKDKTNCGILVMDMNTDAVKRDKLKNKYSKNVTQPIRNKSRNKHRISGKVEDKHMTSTTCSDKDVLISKDSASRDLKNNSYKSKSKIKNKQKKVELCATTSVNELTYSNDCTSTHYTMNSESNNADKKAVSSAEKSARNLISAFEKYQLHHPEIKISADKFNRLLSSENTSCMSNQESSSLLESECCDSTSNHHIPGIQSMPEMPITNTFHTNMDNRIVPDVEMESSLTDKTTGNSSMSNSQSQQYDCLISTESSKHPLAPYAFNVKSTCGQRVTSNNTIVRDTMSPASTVKHSSSIFTPSKKEHIFKPVDEYNKKNLVIIN